MMQRRTMAVETTQGCRSAYACTRDVQGINTLTIPEQYRALSVPARSPTASAQSRTRVSLQTSCKVQAVPRADPTFGPTRTVERLLGFSSR